MPIGAESQGDAGVCFRIWAPSLSSAKLVLESGGKTRRIAMTAEEGGYFSAQVPRIGAGALYRFQLREETQLYPDPASRFQPDGPHGPSEVIDWRSFEWSDQAWTGVPRNGQVIYELHIGTFTPEGTFAAAIEQLPRLAELGVTVLEVMPVAEFPGRFGWGYDGVNLFAPTRLYGRPDDFRRFVDRAHALGLGVILDVVYNHFGPDGNYLRAFSPHYCTDRYENDWGEAIDFDGPHSAAVREYILSNAAYWIEEFHLDGLRLDATQTIFDGSPRHILIEIAETVREAAQGRSTYLVAENEPQHALLVRSVESGGFGLDGIWNDDFHHCAMVAATGRNEAYYSDYLGRPQEFVSMAKHGFLYQGQRYRWQKKRRGTPAPDLDPCRFVSFLQNHDQVANSSRGLRLHRLTGPGRYRALTALLLLGPETPMLFQGQEFAASAPFLFFADHKSELAGAVAKGRREFLAQFPRLATPEAQAIIADPADPATFAASKLDWAEHARHAEAVALHRDLLRLRRDDPVLSRCGSGRIIDGAVLGDEAFLLRYFDREAGADRLLLVNLGRDLQLDPAPEPLLVAPENCRWELRWSSEDPGYGGDGTPEPETAQGWRIPGHATLLLWPVHAPGDAMTGPNSRPEP